MGMKPPGFEIMGAEFVFKLNAPKELRRKPRSKLDAGAPHWLHEL
jgi:hypothetical protein